MLHRPPPDPKGNAVKPGRGDGVPEIDQNKSDAFLLRHNSRPTQALRIVATIDKGRSAQLRVGLSDWRGSHKVELREATSVVPGLFFPTSAGVTLDVSLVPQLLEAIVAVERECLARGLLGRRSA